MNIFRFLSFLKVSYALEYLIGKILFKLYKILPNYFKLAEQHNILTELVIKKNAIINKNHHSLRILVSNDIFFIRDNSSDFDVLNQILLKEEYAYVVDFIKFNINIPLNTIVDAGANIGLSALYFSRNFPSANIFCLESDKSNFDVLKKNTSFINNLQSFNVALWNSNSILSTNSNFRDGRSWSKSVNEIMLGDFSENIVEAIDVNSLFDRYSIEFIDLFKIDIEGSEAKIFSNNSNLSFLDRTNIIVMEIHDEVCDRILINNIMISKGFVIINFNETTLFIKKQLIG